MTSPEQPNSEHRPKPTDEIHPVHEPDASDYSASADYEGTPAHEDSHETTEDRRGRHGSMLGRLASRFVSRGFNKGFNIDTYSLRDAEEQGEEEIRDPLTGEVTGNRTVYKHPFIPIGQKTTHGLKHQKDRDGRETPPYHPLYDSIESAIQTGDFRRAVINVDDLTKTTRNAAEARMGIVQRKVDKRLSSDANREGRIKATYQGLMYGVYDTVMSVPDTLPDITEADNTNSEIYKPQPPVDGDWEAVLDLNNIQALRSHVVQRWTERGAGKEIVDTYIRTGGIRQASPYALSAYLGVDKRALQQQLDGGVAVVPPTVLSKINFFLQYADDEMPESGLSVELARFNDAEPFDDTPIQRVLEARDEYDDKMTEDAAIQEVVETERLPYTEVSNIPADPAPTPHKPRPTSKPQTGNTNNSDAESRQKYLEYFDEDKLKALDEQIHERITHEARGRRNERGINQLPGDEFKDLSREIRRHEIDLYLEGVPEDIKPLVESRLRTVAKKRS